MADKDNKNPPNVSGSFYVDDTCIDCDMCRDHAGQFFIRNDEISMTYVHRQPMSADEIALAEEALENCPSGSIGNDG